MTLRVVLDTNTRFSALLFRGTPGLLVAFLQTGGFLEVVSQTLLDEYQDVLERKSEKSPKAIAAEIASVAARALLVQNLENVSASRDPDDDHILECALAGQADYVITGDRDLLVLGSFRGIPILTIRQFLDQLSSSPNP